MKNSKYSRTGEIAKVGRWEFSANYGIIKSPKGKVLLIEPRLCKLLYFLSLNVHDIVPRSYLVEHIWTDTIVNEESLTRAVSDLRKLLSENFNDALTIETIRGRGYYLKPKEDRKIEILKSKLNPNIGYAILAIFCFIVLAWSIGSALGIVETKFLIAHK